VEGIGFVLYDVNVFFIIVMSVLSMQRMILGARDCIDILRRLYVYIANMDICNLG
jgi:hypothetical protein